MNSLSSRYHDLVKGPFRTPKLLALAGAAPTLLAVVLSVFWVESRPAAAALFAAYVLFALGLGLLLLTRLFGRVHDVHAAVSLYANLSVSDQFRGGLFVDGAAANASLLLFLLKCLTACKPRRVLELGSGQTTKLFASYYHANADVYVCTLEHDEKWVELLRPLLTRDGRCHDYRHAPLVNRDFLCPGTQDPVHTLGYKIPPELTKERFHLVLVDGPDTGPGTPYTREGILEHVPAILAESFVVVFDDAERADERRMVNRFERILRAHGLNFVRFEIQAGKTQSVFCSTDLAFLRSV